jgi:tripartite-type tricarboxylate transporter receptor subunit TctC
MHMRALPKFANETIRTAATVAFFAALFVFFGIAPAKAQSVEEFYAGSDVTLYIGFSAGGGYDVYGRLAARHFGRFLPGEPTIVPVNMEGAGSLRLLNWLYSAAPRDGTAFGIVNRAAPFVPLLDNPELAAFDVQELTWIGSANDEVSVCVAWERTGITRFEQLYEQDLIVGSSGPGADEFVFPRLIRGVLGARVRSVAGYAGGNEINFAMERGEVDGRCGFSWSSVRSTRQHWLDDGSVEVIVQFAREKHPELQDVPLITDFAETETQRRILRLITSRLVLGRPFVAPPDLPEDRVTALKSAFEAMTKDTKFLAEADRLRLEINPVSGKTIETLLAEAYATPRELVEQARQSVR